MLKQFQSFFLRGGLLASALLAFLTLEHFFPLRRATQPKLRRLAINLTLAALGAVLLRFTVYPLVVSVSLGVERSSFGLLPWLGLSPSARLVASILLLDYTLYVWHRINHKIPFLWRFHNAHHVDLDVDVTTASRFHPGELFLSAGFRAGQVAFFGIDPLSLIVFEVAITTAAQFHHANVRLPESLERYLNFFVVTPRMHGIHHSIVREETDSNFSTIFTFWDRLHRSLRLNIVQEEITIGVAAYREPAELGLRNTLLLPFQRPRAWRLPDGTVPKR